MMGIRSPQDREKIIHDLYEAIRTTYSATRERELLAQRDRRRSAAKGGLTATDIAEEIWDQNSQSFGLLEFPEDFLRRASEGDSFDLPPGSVEVGLAMMETGRQLRAGTVRVGGPTGPVLDAGSISRARFLQALSECGYYGAVRILGDEECEVAVQEFARYRQELRRRFAALAVQHTRDQRRQKVVADVLMQRALHWRRSQSEGWD